MADAPATPAPALLIDPAGKVVPANPADLKDLLDAGYVAATPKQVEAYNQEQALKEKYESPAAQISSAILGAGRAATFGLSDAALVAGGVPAEEMRELKERNPGAEMAGEGAAVVLGGLAGAAKKGAAQFTAPALISRAGKAVEGAASTFLPEATTLGGQIARRAAVLGAGSAVEGAAYGLGNVVSEAALGDPNLTAQSAMAEIGLSAAIGGGLGSVLGVAEVGIPAAVTKAKDAVGDLLTKAEGSAEKALPELWARQGVKPEMSQMLLGPAREQYLGLAKEFPAVAEALPHQSLESAVSILNNYKLAVKDPEIRAMMAKLAGDSLQGQIETVEGAYRNALKNILPEERGTLIKQHLGLENKAATEEAARLHKSMEEVVGTLRADKDLYDQGYASALEKLKDGFAKRVGEAESPGQIAEEILNTRRLLDSEIPYKKSLMGLPFSERQSLTLMEPLRAEFKDALKNEAVWGPAGKRIADLNEAQHQYIGALKALLGEDSGSLDSKATKLVQRVGGLHGEIKVIPKKVETWLNQMADPRGGAMLEAVENYRQKAKALIDEIEVSYKTAPVGSFDAPALRSLIDKSGDALKAVREKAQITQVINELDRAGKSGSWGSHAASGGVPTPESMAQTGLEMAAGHALAGMGGAAMAAAGRTVYETARSVPRAVATLSALERLASSVSRGIDSGVSTLVRAGVKGSYVGRGELAAGVARQFGRKDPKSFEKHTNEIRQLAASPDLLHDRLTKQGESIGEHAPDTSLALQMASARAVNFLASKIPQHPKTAPLQADWQASPAEIAKYERFHEAVDNPMVVLKQAAAGTLTPEAVEAVRTVYPDLYNQISLKLIEKLGASSDLPYRSKIMASMLLGMDLDGTIKQLPANQAAFAGPSRKSPDDKALSGASKLSLSNRTMTPSQESSKGTRK